MKEFFKNLSKNIFLIALGLILAITFSYVSAYTKPATTSTNSPEVLNIGTSPQTKDGEIDLFAFLAGNFQNAGSITPSYNFLAINSDGKMAIGSGTPPSSSSNTALDIVGTTGVKGTIRIKNLERSGGSGNREIYADSSGKIVYAGLKEFTNTTQESEYKSFIVPDGVTSVTIEVYGAGGAGYQDSNVDRSWIVNGDNSYVVGNDRSGGSFSIVASGGQAPINFASTGAGGSASTSSTNNKIKSVPSAITSNGGNGGAPSSTWSGTAVRWGLAGNCSGTSYSVMRGKVGNTGGSGGAPYGGSGVSGGAGASPDPNSSFSGGYNFLTVNNTPDCNYKDTISSDYLRTALTLVVAGNNGSNGASYGAGGSSFGGGGGRSGVVPSGSTIITDLAGIQSAYGGGAGGYAKATVNTNGGETFYIKIGHKGVPEVNCLTSQPPFGGGSTLPYCKDLKSLGALSGSGVGGYVKITY